MPLHAPGVEGESEPYLLGSDGDSTGFESSSRKTYVVRAQSLGPLNRIIIRQLPMEENEDGSKEGAAGWFLESIVVIDPDGESWTFPCGEWLGRDAVTQAWGSPERTLTPRTLQLSSLMDPRYLFREMVVSASAFSMPHPEKVAEGVRGVNRATGGWGGEDAYFIARGSESGVVGLGVSDGVYAWRERGVDAGAFSRALVEGCASAVQGGATDALAALQASAEELRASGTRGSATACVVLVNTAAGVMSAANLGDSGWMLLGGPGGARGPAARRRPRALRARSPQQEHAFGYPFQLGSQDAADMPEDAMLTTLPLGPGCTLILGSDGLFDNLDDDAIVAMVDRALDEGCSAAEVARGLAYAAAEAAQNREADTPYSRGATEAFDMIYSGGKQDDITALVALIN